MSELRKVLKVWFVDGQLLTNCPEAFAKNFDLPTTATVDGLTRVSHRLVKKKAKTAEDWTDDLEEWLG